MENQTRTGGIFILTLRLKDLSSNEFEQVVNAVAEKIKNLAYLKADKYAFDTLKAIENDDLFITETVKIKGIKNIGSRFSISINFDIDTGTLAEIIAGVKRKNDNI